MLARRFLQRTPGELATLRECLSACVAGDATAIVQLEQMVHKIHGAGKTFGFEAIGRYAAHLEQLAKAASPGPVHDPEILERLGAGVRHLANEVERSAGLAR